MSQRPLSVQTKLEIIECFEQERPELSELAERFNIGKIQTANIIKDREFIRNNSHNLQDDVRGRRKKTFFNPQGKIIDTACLEWYEKCVRENRPVTGKLIKEKARQIARNIKHHTFVGSNGWLQKWRLRHNVDLKPRFQADQYEALNTSHHYNNGPIKINGIVANTSSNNTYHSNPIQRKEMKKANLAAKRGNKEDNSYKNHDFDPLSLPEVSFVNNSSPSGDETILEEEYTSIFKVDSYISALSAIQDLKNFSQDDDIALGYLNKLEQHFKTEAGI